MSGERKDDHVRLAAAQFAEEPRRNPWDDIAFIHHALAGVDAGIVDASVEIAGARWRHPFLINAMTGGSDRTGRINRDLAIAARETGAALASGSLSAALSDPRVESTFTVIRDENPDGFVLANIGIERSPDDARRAVGLLRADALQVHVNSVQETVMPEGSREFSRWRGSLEAILAAVDVPVIVKEVGFGLSARTLALLAEMGVAYADVSGTGGTDFVRIENDRRPDRDYAYLVGWGQSAALSLLEAPASAPVLIASGGVRTPLDVVRALALGARAVGASAPFLGAALAGGSEAVVDLVRTWDTHTVALLALLGARTPADLARTDLTVRGETADDARARGIDLARWAHRSA